MGAYKLTNAHTSGLNTFQKYYGSNLCEHLVTFHTQWFCVVSLCSTTLMLCRVCCNILSMHSQYCWSGEKTWTTKTAWNTLAPRNEHIEPTQQWRKVWKNNVSYSKETWFNVDFQMLPAVPFFEEITPLDPCMLFTFIYNYICWFVYWIWVNIHGWYGHDFQNMHLFTVQKLKTHGW